MVCLNISLCRLRSAGIPIVSPDHQIIILISRIERFKSFQTESLLHCGIFGSPFKVIKLSSTVLSLAMPKKREMDRSRGVRGPLTLSRFHCRLTLSHAPHPLPTPQPLPLTPLLTLFPNQSVFISARTKMPQQMLRMQRETLWRVDEGMRWTFSSWSWLGEQREAFRSDLIAHIHDAPLVSAVKPLPVQINH